MGERSKVEEQRRAPRRRVLLDGRVIFNNRFSIIECTIRDLSDTGAKVVFQHPTPLPPEVGLEIFKTGESFQARVVRSDGKTHGLMFVREEGQGTRPPEAAPAPASTGPIQAIVDEARYRIA